MTRNGGAHQGYRDGDDASAAVPGAGALRNVRIGERRTSLRLEPEMWEALGEICAATGKGLNEICTEVYRANAGRSNFTSGMRVFIVEYYRTRARDHEPPRLS